MSVRLSHACVACRPTNAQHELPDPALEIGVPAELAGGKTMPNTLYIATLLQEGAQDVSPSSDNTSVPRILRVTSGRVRMHQACCAYMALAVCRTVRSRAGPTIRPA